MTESKTGLTADLPAKIRLSEKVAIQLDGNTYAVGIIPNGPVFAVSGPGALWVEELLHAPESKNDTLTLLEHILIESPLTQEESYTILNSSLRELVKIGVIEAAN